MAARRIFSAQRDGKTLVVALENNVGSLADADILGEIREIVEAIERHAISGVVVDFADIAYFGSSMLEGLRAIWTQLHAGEGRMVLCNVSDVGRDILHLAKFDTLWPIFESRSKALESLAD